MIGLENREISENRLKRFLDWLNPDDMLKFIRIPHFVVTKSDKSLSLKNAQPQAVPHTPSSTALTLAHILKPPNNCQIIFQHLKASRGVNAILDVAVDDLSRKRAPHTNEVIIACLREFRNEIEKWDWRKIDMCIDAVIVAAPNIKDIHLYSSGNNAVLKSWSALDGLPGFPLVSCI